jgi:DNA-binding helix-hairpin-helix protein with protein kinase domain
MYVDGQGRDLRLGPLLGRGGEGSVYLLNGHPDLVAKIYHDPIDSEKQDKLKVMSRGVTEAIKSISAWPLEPVVSKADRRVHGLVMTKVSHHNESHQIYSPADRKSKFPKLNWKFLTHVAMNCAAAFETVHNHGLVIGDVNPGGILVSPSAGTVRLIDCDSFQYFDGHRTFLCRVGASLYTPPELVGRDFATTTRKPSHDQFGLALLVFHLLFMGRHPFSGTHSGPEDMPIERAILEGRYAFARDAAQRKMRMPPRSVGPSELCPSLAEMFEQAFLTTSARPTAGAWRAALRGLRDRVTTCSVDAIHVYSSEVGSCPWCSAERKGATFFVSDSVSFEFDPAGECEAIWVRIDRLIPNYKHPERAPLQKQLRGRPWPADANPHAAGKELPLPPRPAEPRYELLPPIPRFEDPPPPPQPTFEPLPKEPIFVFRPSVPAPQAPIEYLLPPYVRLPMPSEPREPRLLGVPKPHPPFDAEAVRSAAWASFGRGRHLTISLLFRLPLCLSGVATVAFCITGQGLALTVAGAAFAVFLIPSVVSETYRARWTGKYESQRKQAWSVIRDRVESERNNAVKSNGERRAVYERELAIHRQTSAEIKAGESRRLEEYQRTVREARAQHRIAMEAHKKAMDEWAQRVSGERHDQLLEWQSVHERVRVESEAAKDRNQRRRTDWESTYESLKLDAKEAWRRRCEDLERLRNLLDGKNAVLKTQHETEIKRWEAEVERIKSNNGAVYLCRGRFENERNARQRDVDRLRRAYGELHAEVERRESGRIAEFTSLKEDARRLIDEFRRRKSSFDSDRLKLSGPAEEAQLTTYLSAVLIREHNIPGIGEGRLTTLELHGVETAFDVSEETLDGISGFKTGKGRMALLAWRGTITRKFTFNPQAAIRPVDLAMLHSRHKQGRLEIQDRLAGVESRIRERLDRVTRDRQSESAELEDTILALNIAEADLSVALTL